MLNVSIQPYNNMKGNMFNATRMRNRERKKHIPFIQEPCDVILSISKTRVILITLKSLRYLKAKAILNYKLIAHHIKTDVFWMKNILVFGNKCLSLT